MLFWEIARACLYIFKKIYMVLAYISNYFIYYYFIIILAGQEYKKFHLWIIIKYFLALHRSAAQRLYAFLLHIKHSLLEVQCMGTMEADWYSLDKEYRRLYILVFIFIFPGFNIKVCQQFPDINQFFVPGHKFHGWKCIQNTYITIKWALFQEF